MWRIDAWTWSKPGESWLRKVARNTIGFFRQVSFLLYVNNLSIWWLHCTTYYCLWAPAVSLGCFKPHPIILWSLLICTEQKTWNLFIHVWFTFDSCLIYEFLRVISARHVFDFKWWCQEYTAVQNTRKKN